jgi:hypothetical protein
MRRFKLLKGAGNYHANAPLPAAKKAFTQLVKSGLHRQVFQIRELDIENPKALMYLGVRKELEIPRTRTIRSPDGLTEYKITYKYQDHVRRLFKRHYHYFKRRHFIDS